MLTNNFHSCQLKSLKRESLTPNFHDPVQGVVIKGGMKRVRIIVAQGCHFGYKLFHNISIFVIFRLGHVAGKICSNLGSESGVNPTKPLPLIFMLGWRLILIQNF